MHIFRNMYRSAISLLPQTMSKCILIGMNARKPLLSLSTSSEDD